MSTATYHKRSGTFTATVDVDIDLADLEDAGWHHEDECPASNQPVGYTSLLAAVDSLHQQAHDRFPLRMCRKEPCRSLSLGQIEGAA